MPDQFDTPAARPAHLEALRVIARHRHFIVLVCVSAMICALALTYVFSEKYRSGIAVFYRHSEVTLLRPVEQQAFGSPAPNTPFKVISQTVQEIVQSEALLRPIVLDLQLHVDEKVYEGPWYKQLYERSKDWIRDLRDKAVAIVKYGRIIEEDPVWGAIQGLRKSIDVVNKDSFIFLILVRDKRPQRAARIAEAIGAELVTFLRHQLREAGRLQEVQLAELMEVKSLEMDQYQNEIEDLYRQNNIASVDEERAHSIERWSALELSRVQLDSEIKNLREKIAGIDTKLEGASGSRRGYIGPEDKRRLESEQLFAALELEGMQAKYESIAGTLDEMRQRLAGLPAVELKLDQLQTAYEGAKRDWVQLRDAHQGASMRASQTVSEAKVLHAATVPTQPMSPVKIYHVGLAGTLALLFAVGLAFVFDFFEMRLFESRRAAPASGPDPAAPADAAPTAMGELLPAPRGDGDGRSEPAAIELASTDMRMARFAEDLFEVLERKRLLDRLDLPREAQDRLELRRDLRRRVYNEQDDD